MTPAEYEQDLTAHLQQYPSVHCVVQSSTGDPCAPTMSAAVPEFVPPTTRVATNVAQGCAKIEASGGSTLPATPVPLPGPFQFDEASAAETPQVIELADEAAAAIKKDPRIECVAIKGMSAPGESFSLANERAQAVRKLLEARGIDHSRVTVFEGTAPTYTAGPGDQPIPAEHRRVHLAVVVYSSAAGQ
jgi:outer membrane protein OmpA-like peptidoglycan-associated protein